LEMIDMAKVVTPAELAEKFETDGRTVRKFLRSITPRDEQPGKGGRWSIDGTAKSVNKLQRQFNDWHQKQLEERAERARKAAEDAANAEVDEIEDEVETD
jgi:DeoR/GlpR family transcriptional regulator of sugar metabolism